VHSLINSKNKIFAEADIVLQPTLNDNINKENIASTSNEINDLQKENTIDGYVS